MKSLKRAIQTKLNKLLAYFGYKSSEQAFHYIYDGTNNCSIKITGYDCSRWNISIPEMIGNRPVTSIKEFAFSRCTILRSITFPFSITSIGYMAFNRCKNLRSIALPCHITTIEDGTFYDCENLRNIEIPDVVTSIGHSAFQGCARLTSFIIPNGVTFIKDKTFAGCTNLESVVIPDSVTSIGECVFSGCYSLKNITIPNSVTSIGEGAFFECISLEDFKVGADNRFYSAENGVLFNKRKTRLIVYPAKKEGGYTIPETVKTIGARAFWRCNNLTSITIPDSVINIDDSAFYGCRDLKEIYFKGHAPWLGKDVFSYTSPIIYFRSGMSRWSQQFGGCQTALWKS